jgi:(2Fe-2S) ferredoxin
VEIRAPRFERYVFVCEHLREDGACCLRRDGAAIREALKEAVKVRRLQHRIRVSRSGCLDVCDEGANVLVYPVGRWYAHVTLADVPAIVDEVVRSLKVASS